MSDGELEKTIRQKSAQLGNGLLAHGEFDAFCELWFEAYNEGWFHMVCTECETPRPDEPPRVCPDCGSTTFKAMPPRVKL